MRSSKKSWEMDIECFHESLDKNFATVKSHSSDYNLCARVFRKNKTDHAHMGAGCLCLR